MIVRFPPSISAAYPAPNIPETRFQAAGQPTVLPTMAMSDTFVRFAGNKPETSPWQRCLSQGIAAFDVEDYSKAQQCFMQSLRILNRDNLSEVTETFNWLGCTLSMLEDPDAALNFFNAALKTAKKYQGISEIGLVKTYVNLGEFFHLYDEPEQAANHFDKAISTLEAAKKKPGKLPCSPYEAFHTYSRAGYFFQNFEDLKKSVPLLEKAYDTYLKHLQRDSSPRVFAEVVNLQESLAEIYMELKQEHRAESTLEELLELQKQRYGPDSSELLTVLDMKSDMLELFERDEESQEVLEEMDRILRFRDLEEN